jgi:hypothetical protein
VHLIPTDKPSRLVLDTVNKNLFLTTTKDFGTKIMQFQNIYITNDEEIKEGDWIFSLKTNNIFKADSIEYLKSHNMIEDFDKSFYINSKSAKKIILTTDQDLIKDGIQAIDDEFLEWFVKNLNCEGVEVEKQMLCDYCGQEHCDNFRCRGYKDSVWYEIIIPREEPKQDTIEEAADNWVRKPVIGTKRESFIAGANWQAERMYSEEEVIKIVEKSRETGLTAEFLLLTEQFKKK